MRPRRHAGFTLIELMITLAVAVVLIVLAVPSFRDLTDKSRLRGATDDIVNLLNVARGSAVKYGRNVNVSINSGGWCAGARSAEDQTATTPGNQVGSVTACDCTAGTVTCKVGGQNLIVSSADYSGVTLSTVDTTIAYSTGAATEGITFNSKFGALDLSNLPGSPLVTLLSPTQKYSTRITVSPLGQVYACSVGTRFISGYPSC